LWIRVSASALNRVPGRTGDLEMMSDVAGGLGGVHTGEGVTGLFDMTRGEGRRDTTFNLA